MDELLTTNEVAKSLKRHPVTIRRALEDGTLHGIQRSTGAQWRVAEPCAKAYAEGIPCAHRQTNVIPLHKGQGGAA